MDELARRLAAGPGHFIHAIDAPRDLLLLVELDEARIREASFLDQRVLTPQIWGRWLPFDDIRQRLDPAARDDAHYIFHIGHVGSTLISRLLGEAPNVVALREPLVLRELDALIAKRDAADAPWPPESLPERIAVVRKLLARTFAPGQRAIVKATSFTSEIAPELVTSEARAVLLYTTLESYMTTILAGENSRVELSAITLPRLARLARRLDECAYRLWSLREGERIAIGWITEMLSLQAAADALPPGSVLWVDFDDMLERPAESLLEIARHYDLGWTRADAEQVVTGPIMQRYSKAPEHGYSAGLRRERQRQAALQHRSALTEGLRLIDKMVATYPKTARLAPKVRPG